MTIINIPKTTKSTPPYLAGLLCLIPLIGGMAGFVLLILAIVKYRDKWLAIIGAAGILFTVGIYGFMFYYMKNGDLSKRGFAEISQMQLNNLVKNIEFYKLQHGEYPDNLQELLEDDKFAPIHDAIQSAQFRGAVFYNYERIGSRYTLFSSGQDGKPHTKDDLFPKVAVSDSSKIGLIKTQ
ncbi:type II secretion system protein GspG [Chitinophaga arvensicola]|uniref:Type II secretion system (T2SS), protein G n=1 Tax=Chitinophaga arvensicola TaxID=29529 RepID=A0A1I0S9E6_9BACT|nr:type II secretion system protein GspG [Chitinophaga arvensicola]SEW52786.1 Type II secretion system (T2SS), protein G [Chitinophaga arvensicola]